LFRKLFGYAQSLWCSADFFKSQILLAKKKERLDLLLKQSPKNNFFVVIISPLPDKYCGTIKKNLSQKKVFTNKGY
jgi:hypothetical protein